MKLFGIGFFVILGIANGTLLLYVKQSQNNTKIQAAAQVSYLPSPPQSQFGVMTTSRQLSVSVLYT